MKKYLLALGIVMTLLWTATAPASATEATDVAAVPVVDSLSRSEYTLSNSGKWSALQWDNAFTKTGTDYGATGWGPSSLDAFPSIAGAYWGTSPGSGAVAAGLTLNVSPELAESGHRQVRLPAALDSGFGAQHLLGETLEVGVGSRDRACLQCVRLDPQRHAGDDLRQWRHRYRLDRQRLDRQLAAHGKRLDLLGRLRGHRGGGQHRPLDRLPRRHARTHLLLGCLDGRQCLSAGRDLRRCSLGRRNLEQIRVPRGQDGFARPLRSAGPVDPGLRFEPAETGARTRRPAGDVDGQHRRNAERNRQWRKRLLPDRLGESGARIRLPLLLPLELPDERHLVLLRQRSGRKPDRLQGSLVALPRRRRSAGRDQPDLGLLPEHLIHRQHLDLQPLSRQGIGRKIEVRRLELRQRPQLGDQPEQAGFVEELLDRLLDHLQRTARPRLGQADHDRRSHVD